MLLGSPHIHQMWSLNCLLTMIHAYMLLIHFSVLIPAINGRPRPMGEALQRAIERTKQFQSTDRDRRVRPLLTQTAIKQRKIQPVRLQKLDVDKLNRLLKTLDKTWIMPKPGQFEPIGSNFQYKKTCASIYRARSNACDQLGFGIMCFNFCYEQGENMEYKCEELSDSQFCKTHSNYDQFLSKYRKDPYRTKAYIHQQLTRCYMSSVCNGALLNTSLMRSPNNFAEFPLYLRALKNRPKAQVNISAELDSLLSNKDNWERSQSALSGRRLRKIESTGDFGGEGPSKKYVPFWQRLLVRKNQMEQTTPPPELTIEEDAEEEQRWLERRFGRKLAQWQTTAMTTTQRHREDDEEEAPQRLVGTLSMEPIGFWNKFQPGKWFQSVHYITNTG